MASNVHADVSVQWGTLNWCAVAGSCRTRLTKTPCSFFPKDAPTAAVF